jgi:hypothetical protein
MEEQVITSNSVRLPTYTIKRLKDGYKTVSLTLPYNALLDKRCPVGEIGDIVWLQEAFYIVEVFDEAVVWHYKIDDEVEGERPQYMAKVDSETYESYNKGKNFFRTAKAMPAWMSRFTLQIKNIQIMYYSSLSVLDLEEQGVFLQKNEAMSLEQKYDNYWTTRFVDRMYDPNMNPLIWLIEFEVIG